MIRAYLIWVTLRAAGRALRAALKVAAAVAALLAATPATVVAAYSYAIAWLLGWPPRRLYRAAAWCLPMLAVWVTAQALRTGRWGEVWREPFGAWRQMWRMAASGAALAGLDTAAPIAIPAGLLIGALAWSYRVFSMETGTGGLTANSPITFDLRQWRHQARTARARIAAPGAVPLISRRGEHGQDNPAAAAVGGFRRRRVAALRLGIGPTAAADRAGLQGRRGLASGR